MTRRFQFSLRALLVAAIIVGGPFVWIGDNARLVHQRRTMRPGFHGIGCCLAEVKVSGDTFYDPVLKMDRRLIGGIHQVDLPWMRRVMGDTPVKVLLYDPGEDADRSLLRARTLFPEARIVYSGDWGRAPIARD